MSDTLVKYGEHPKVSPGTACESCGGTESLPVTDHCHLHGWVRGLVCARCNHLMSIIDRRIAPKVESVLLAALITLQNRCPGCGQLGIADLGSGAPQSDICSIVVRAADARRKMRDILTAVEHGEPVQIQRYDTPTAIVVSPDWFKRALVALGEPEPTFEEAQT